MYHSSTYFRLPFKQLDAYVKELFVFTWVVYTAQVVVQTNDMIATSDAATMKYNASESMLRSERVLKYAKSLSYKNSHIV